MRGVPRHPELHHRWLSRVRDLSTRVRLKRAAYEMGKVPAARCNASKEASRASLQKAGMLPCAGMLAGPLRLG